MSALYIPPKGLYFRLLGLKSNQVLFSRNGTEPQFSHHPREDIRDDQWWDLSPGSGNHEGYYLVRSKHTGKVIYSRNQSDPLVGHVGGNRTYEDNWFKFEAGTGKFANCFRLRSKPSDRVLVSDLTRDHQVWNHPGDQICEEQYFAFLIEDTEIDRVEYDINKGKILSSVPEVFGSENTMNSMTKYRQVEFEFSKTKTTSSSFDYKLGCPITEGATKKIGLPIVAEGSIKIDLSNSHTFKWGSTTTESRAYSKRFPALEHPRKKITVTATITRSQIEVPFTIYSKSVATGNEVRTEGIYLGVTYWDIQCSIKQEDLPEGLWVT